MKIKFEDLINLYLEEPVVSDIDPAYELVISRKTNPVTISSDRFNVVAGCDAVSYGRAGVTIYGSYAEKSLLKDSASKMKFPLDSIPATPFMVESLRLNLCAYLFEKGTDHPVDKLRIVYYKWENEFIPVRYRPDLIERWIEHYLNEYVGYEPVKEEVVAEEVLPVKKLKKSKKTKNDEIDPSQSGFNF